MRTCFALFFADEIDEDLRSVADATSGILLSSLSIREQLFTVLKTYQSEDVKSYNEQHRRGSYMVSHPS